MCFVPKKGARVKKSGVGWKVFREGLKPMFYDSSGRDSWAWSFRRTAYKVKTWYENTSGPGFHLFTNKKDATVYADYDSVYADHEYTIRKVLFKNARPSRSKDYERQHSSAHLAEQIYILPAKESK